MPPSSRPRSCYLIGIDFGTTFSGVAWSKSPEHRTQLDPRNIHVVTDWTGGRGYAKVPTQILYSAGNDPKCGYEVPENADPLRWFKLLLVKEEELPEHMRESGDIKKIKNARKRLEDERKTIEQVIADYLRFLWNQAISSIERSETAAVVNATPYVVVLTFPAIWKPAAVQKMQDAAKQAGILDPRRRAADTVLHFVAEPEAAALATYADLSEEHPAFVRGETFVVLDAGGGTCDLITYEVLGTSPLQLKECVRGDGGLCGAIFLDEEFEKKLKGWIGGERKAKTIDRAAYRRLLDDGWERVLKRDFDGEERDWSFAVPLEWQKKSLMTKFSPFKKKPNQSAINGSRLNKPTIAGSELSIPTESIKEVFRPILDKIYELVREQVTEATRTQGRSPKAILLAGGLGSNRYLHHYLDRRFSGIDILQRPYPQPWSAICRGAVHRAKVMHAPALGIDEANFNEGVTSRKSRLNYGIVKYVDFVEGYHLELDRYYMESTNREVAVNQMVWYVKRDDDMQDREPTRMNWKRYLSTDEPRTSIEVELWESEVSPPTRKTAQVRLLCSIRARLPSFDGLPTCENEAGKSFRVVSFDLLLTPQGNSLEWSVWINGEKQGEKAIAIVYN